MCTGSFPGVKRSARDVDHPSPSSTEIKGRIELYIYSPSEPSWPVLGRTLPLPLPNTVIIKCIPIKLLKWTCYSVLVTYKIWVMWVLYVTDFQAYSHTRCVSVKKHLLFIAYLQLTSSRVLKVKVWFNSLFYKSLSFFVIILVFDVPIRFMELTQPLL